MLAKRRRSCRPRGAWIDEYIASWFQYAPVTKPNAPRTIGSRQHLALRGRTARRPERHEHRHPGHPRHSGPLRRLRDIRRRTFDASGRARPRGDGLLPRAPLRGPATAACACDICPPSGTSTSTPWPTRSSRRCTCWATGADAALYCNAANAVFTWLPRLCGMPVALNVDGLERKRKKWNRLARSLVPGSRSGWRHFARPRWSPTRGPSRSITAGATSKASTFIPYGAEIGKVADDGGRSERLGLEPGRYFLYVSRMEPENNRAASARGLREGADRLQAGAGRRRALRGGIHRPRARHRATRAS